MKLVYLIEIHNNWVLADDFSSPSRQGVGRNQGVRGWVQTMVILHF